MSAWTQFATIENGVCASSWLSYDRSFYLFLEKSGNDLHYVKRSSDVIVECFLIRQDAPYVHLEIAATDDDGYIKPPHNTTLKDWRKTVYDLFAKTYQFKVFVSYQMYGNSTFTLVSPCLKPDT